MYRRRDPRFHLHLPIRFMQCTLTGTGFALNLSREGCLLETDAGLIEGDYLEVRLSLPGLDPPLRIQSAAVRWVRGRVCGLEFLYLYGRGGWTHESATFSSTPDFRKRAATGRGRKAVRGLQPTAGSPRA